MVADLSIVERLRGTRQRLGANRPFRMNDPERVWYVERGHLDVFAVEWSAGEAVGRRRFVTRVPAGELAFGAPPLPANGAAERELGFLAVPSQDAVVVRGERAGISAEAFDLAATTWVDEWIARLSDFVARDRLAPRQTHLIEADPDVPVPAGAILTAHHLDVIWVTSTAGLRYLGRRDTTFAAPDPPLPMTERTWLENDEDTELTAVYTPTALLTDRLWPAFDRFGTLVLKLAAAADARDAEALAERRRAARLARQVSAAGALRALRRVLRSKEADAVRIADEPPLRQAARLVAESIGVTLEPGGREAADPERSLVALAGRSRMHLRWVTLRAGWWKEAGPSMVGFARGDAGDDCGGERDGGDGSGARGERDGDGDGTRDADRDGPLDGGRKPLALLSEDRGAYRAVDPATGESFAVNAATAENVEPRAAVFYAPLPEVVKGVAQLARFALHGRWADGRAVVASTILGGLAAMVAPILTGQFLTEIVPRGEASAWLAAIGALVAVALGSGVFQIVRGLAMLRIQSRFDQRAAAAVWGRLMSLPARFFRDYSAGDLALRAGGTNTIRRALTSAGASAATGLASTVFSLVLLFYLSWPMALLVTFLLTLQSATMWLLTLGRLRHERRSQRLAGELNGFVLQVLRGLAKLRVANAESRLLDRWARQYGEWRREKLAGAHWLAAGEAFMAAAQPLTLVAIFGSVVFLLGRDADAFDLAAFLSFHAAFGQLSAGIGSLTSVATALTDIVPTVERLRPILDAAPEPRGGIELPDIKGDIEFDNVTFRYAPDAPNAVEGVSFSIRQGDYVAFVGPSGCGKSTLYRLLLGFERPNSGTVFLDGHNVASLDMHSVRGRLGVVLQNGRVTAGSVYENIAGIAPVSMKDAWAAARAAAIEDDIRAMPMGMHTRLPEGGAGLSVGQKQRLLIARALALKPRVLLFDEATSALDNRSQDVVQESLKDLGVTRLVIAHRLSSIRHVDRIHVLQDGRVVETGGHDDLMRQDGVFATLARRQLVQPAA